MAEDSRPRRESAVLARRRVLRFAQTQTVHLGSSLSVLDVVDAILRRADEDETDAGRSPLIMSKGHAVWALYALMAERGCQDYQDAGVLPGHPADGFPGIDVATGALGHGLSIAAGLVEGHRLAGRDVPVYVVMGDGELNEGSVWEAAMYAAHRGLGRLVAVVDVNGMQQEGATKDVLDLGSLERKWQAFGWRVLNVDGHDHAALDNILADAGGGSSPTVVLAHTVKGKGVAFMEHNAAWHTGRLAGEELEAALGQLGAATHG